MNKMIVWCPECKKYQTLKKTILHYFLFEGDCNCYIRDSHGTRIKGQDQLIKTLASGIWRAGTSVRRR